jgi:hypothetical protein
MNGMANSIYIVMTSRANVSGKARRPYYNVAVVEVDPDLLPEQRRWFRGFIGPMPKLKTPSMISTHARGVIQILWHSGPMSSGITEKCQYRKTLAFAQKLAQELNETSPK